LRQPSAAANHLHCEFLWTAPQESYASPYLKVALRLYLPQWPALPYRVAGSGQHRNQGIITLTKHPLGLVCEPPLTEAAGAPGIVTPAKFEAGVHAIMDFFPAEWGGRRGIRPAEATAVLLAILNSMGLSHPSAGGAQGTG
jgi:hypothetical protein